MTVFTKWCALHGVFKLIMRGDATMFLPLYVALSKGCLSLINGWQQIGQKEHTTFLVAGYIKADMALMAVRPMRTCAIAIWTGDCRNHGCRVKVRKTP